MKRNLLFPLFVLLVFSVRAQVCIPNDSVFPPDTTGIYPPPYDSTLMTGGIPESACINEYYESVFTFKVGDTITFNGFQVPLIKISLNPTGAVSGLPPGLTYACNPPTCVFEANTSGCAVVYGTVQAGTPPGEYILLINATITLPVFGDIPQTFPGALFPNSSYSIEVLPEGTPGCFVLNTTLPEGDDIAVSASPNPADGIVNLQVTSRISDEIDLCIFDLTGRLIEHRAVQIHQGENHFTTDFSGYAPGMYLYSFGRGKEGHTGKIVVSR